VQAPLDSGTLCRSAVTRGAQPAERRPFAMAGLLARQRLQQSDALLWPKSPPRVTNEHHSGVVNLRVRLLEEARQQRERCLRNPDSPVREPLSARRHFVQDAPVQTEPDVTASAPRGWTQADEDAQAEAIRTIQRLSERGGSISFREAVRGVEESVGRQALGLKLAEEQRLSAGARDQVACLEQELDNKESTIRVLEQTLESRDQELRDAQQQVRRLLWLESERARDANMPPGADPIDYERMRALREQVLELECQLHRKDLEIARLSAVNTRRTPVDKGALATDEVSTLSGSERSFAHRSGSSAAASCLWGP